MLQHLLREESIGINFQAETRNQALERMIDLLPKHSFKPEQKRDLLDLMIERENFGTTATGEGVALPHCIFSGASFPLASLGISREGVKYPSLGGEPVYLIFMVILPELEDTRKLKAQVLQLATQIFYDKFLRERLKIATSQEEAYEILLRESNYSFPVLQNSQIQSSFFNQPAVV